MRFRGHLERRHVFAILGLLLLIAAIICVYIYRQEEKVYLAFFGRIGNVPYANIHRHALTHYLDELSDEVDGYRFVLETFYLDDGNGEPDQPETLRRLYDRRVVHDDRYALVLDNTWAKHIQPLDTLVREKEIPVLSLNADKGDTDFGNHAIFMGHSDSAPVDLVTYLNEALHPATVAFVAEKDYWLTDEFLALTHEPAGGRLPRLDMDYQHLVSSEDVTQPEQSALRRQLESWFEEAPSPAVLLLNVHNDWGKDIISFVDDHLENVTILAAAYAAREGRANFDGKSGNRLILMTAPEDAVSKRVRNDSEHFHSRYPDAFTEDFNLPYYVKHCLDAVEIIREALKHATSEDSDEKRLKIDRALFSTFFRQELIGRSVPGRYDLYRFDDEGRRIPEISFVEFKNNQPTSLWQQLNSRREIIPTVFFGIDLLDIGRLDPVNGTFHADFYYWFNIEDGDEGETSRQKAHAGRLVAEEVSAPRPPKVAGREVTEYIHFSNLSTVASKTYIAGSQGENYWLERISAEFNVDFELDDYPLDTQELTLDLELANPFDDVRLAFNEAAFRKVRRNVENFDIPGWRMVDSYPTVDNVVTRALRGSAPRQNWESSKYKKLTVRIVTERKVQSALISVALPLCTIGVTALSLLFIRDLRFSRVGDVYVGVFLSIITYSIAFAQITPATGVVTRADYLFYLTFLIVLLVFLRFVVLNVFGRVTQDQGGAETGHRRALGYTAVATYVLAVLAIAFLCRDTPN